MLGNMILFKQEICADKKPLKTEGLYFISNPKCSPGNGLPWREWSNSSKDIP